MIKIGSQGPTGKVSKAELARLRARFSRVHHVRLPEFLEPELTSSVQRRLAAAVYKESSYLNGLNVRQTPADPAVGVFLWMLFSDRRVLDFVSEVTGEDAAGPLTGGVFRMLPGGVHRLGWHQDLENDRRTAAMTVNLGPEPIRGGELEIRTHPGRAALGRVPYGSAGDAILFRIRPDLEHRSAPLKGLAPKTIYSAWFHRGRPAGPAIS